MADDSNDSAGSRESGVVEPDELDIEDDEHVRALGDNRYVVSANDPIGKGDTPRGSRGGNRQRPEGDTPIEEGPVPDAGTQPGAGDVGTPGGRENPRDVSSDSIDVHRARACLTERMVERNGAYGFDITAQFGEQVVQQHLQANDIVTVLDALLLWYAEHLDDETPAEEAIGILLTESDIPVKYPPKALISLVRAHGLDPEDSISELIDAACDGMVQFPPK
jgi:hypothetical protein